MNADQLIRECTFQFTRSGGKGGQHVNKVSTKVELYFHAESSAALSDEEKAMILVKRAADISAEGLLKITCDETRSQKKNKEIAIVKFIALIERSLKKAKPRKKTKPTKSSKAQRLNEKKKRSEIKNKRGPVDDL